MKNKIEWNFDAISTWWIKSDEVLENIDKMKKILHEDWWFSRWDNLDFSWLSEDQNALLSVFIDAVTYKKMADMIQRNSSSSDWDYWWIVWLIIVIISIIVKVSW